MDTTIECSFVQEKDVYTVQMGTDSVEDIVFDYRGVPENERSGNSTKLLLAAVMSCFCGSLRAAMVARNIPFSSIRAHARAVKRRNEVGAFRIASVELDITADVDRNFLKEFEHCAKIVKSCTIAGSLMDGMDVVHHIRTA